jgi:hypothetical protein
MTEQMKKLVAAVKAHANANYEKGWDVVVECYTDEELAKEIGKATTEAGAIRKVGQFVGLYNERKREVESFIF